MENLKIDPCLSNPCLNRGECIQLRYGQYKCECTGTNFYGEKCEKGITSAILLAYSQKAKVDYYALLKLRKK